MSRSYRQGGHTGSYKFSKKYTTKKVRRASRDFCNQVRVDSEIDESSDLEKDPNYYCDFKSGWASLNRWLESHVGDNWDDVYSELSLILKNVLGKDEFVKHTVKNLVDLNPTENEKVSFYRYGEFYVDDDWLLRKKDYIDTHKHYGVNKKKLIEFLDGRVIGKYDGKYYWFTPVVRPRSKQEEYKCLWFEGEYYERPWNERYLRYVKKAYTLVDDGFGKRWKWEWVDIAGYGETVNTRKLDPLNDKEVAWLEGLPIYYREEILKWSPSNCE